MCEHFVDGVGDRRDEEGAESGDAATKSRLVRQRPADLEGDVVAVAIRVVPPHVILTPEAEDPPGIARNSLGRSFPSFRMTSGGAVAQSASMSSAISPPVHVDVVVDPVVDGAGDLNRRAVAAVNVHDCDDVSTCPRMRPRPRPLHPPGHDRLPPA